MIFLQKGNRKNAVSGQTWCLLWGIGLIIRLVICQGTNRKYRGPRTHNPIIYGKSTKTLLKVSYMPSSWKARLHLERCHIKNFLLRHLFFSDFKVLEIGKTAAGAPPPFLYLGFQATPESFSSIGSASVGNFFFFDDDVFLQFLSTSLCL